MDKPQATELIFELSHPGRRTHRLPACDVPVPEAAALLPADARTGFEAVTVKSNAKGLVDLDDLRAKLDERTAVFMITNPNTLGLFEAQIKTITGLVHGKGGLIYLDGANMNAILGVTRPGDFGADMMHYNVHKTFTGPHGAGGPGAGPIAVRPSLAPYLPAPVVVKDGDRFRHEFLASARGLRRQRQISAMDIAKRLLDFGYHAPTVYFPLVVPEALMIEPTETESKETLDAFADTLLRIHGEDPELLHQAPHTLSISRPDEVRAAKEPILRWT